MKGETKSLHSRKKKLPVKLWIKEAKENFNTG